MAAQLCTDRLRFIHLALMLFSCSEVPAMTSPQLPPLPPPNAPATCFANLMGEPPARLSESGCFSSMNPFVASPDMIPYALAAPLYTDGAHKQRWFSIPSGSRIQPQGNGNLDFPDGSVLVKLFELDVVESGSVTRQPVEVRVLVSTGGSWRAFTYRWDNAMQDGVLLTAGQTVDVTVPATNGGTETFAYGYPSRDGCVACHRDGLEVLGPNTNQLDLDVAYGSEVRPQLDALMERGLFDEVEEINRSLRTMPDPFDESAPLEDRARAYLHGNCGHCHRPGGFSAQGLTLDMRWTTPLTETSLVCVPTQYPILAGRGYRVHPASPADSVILKRMRATTSPLMMPPLGRALVDERGAALVEEWIRSLPDTACPTPIW